MYNTSYFKTKNDAAVLLFMKAHPFITLCGVNELNEPVATHLPVLIEERDNKIILLAHAMKKQQHTLAFSQHAKVLAIFSGAHTYVSASWYEKKNVASTWNYQAVHAKGIIRFMNDDELHNLLARLTDFFEGNPHSPASVKNMSEEYVQQNMKAIIGFEIELTEIEHVFKLSQNRDQKTYENIIEHLQKGDEQQKQIADIMQQQKDQLF